MDSVVQERKAVVWLDTVSVAKFCLVTIITIRPS